MSGADIEGGQKGHGPTGGREVPQLNLTIGRARLKSPGSIWGALILVLTNRKLKKWGQFGPCGPPIPSFNWAHWYFGPHFCLYGPDFGPKLALFTTKIRNFFIKYQCFDPKSGAFSCRGGGQGTLATAPGSAPVFNETP